MPYEKRVVFVTFESIFFVEKKLDQFAPPFIFHTFLTNCDPVCPFPNKCSFNLENTLIKYIETHRTYPMGIVISGEFHTITFLHFPILIGFIEYSEDCRIVHH